MANGSFRRWKELAALGLVAMVAGSCRLPSDPRLWYLVIVSTNGSVQVGLAGCSDEERLEGQSYLTIHRVGSNRSDDVVLLSGQADASGFLEVSADTTQQVLGQTELDSSRFVYFKADVRAADGSAEEAVGFTELRVVQEQLAAGGNSITVSRTTLTSIPDSMCTPAAG